MTSILRRTPPSAPLRLPSTRPRVLVLLAWYATGVFRGIAQYARDARWILDSNFERSGTVPTHWRGDGILCVLGVEPAVDRLVAARGLPTVNIGYTPTARTARVAAQQEAIGQLAADHFRQRGCRHFAYFLRSGEPGDQGRLAAFRTALGPGAALSVLDWPAAARATRRAPDDASRRRWLGAALRALPHPLAVFAEIDDYAIEVIEAAQQVGLSVPEQVAVLGVGNDELRCPFAPVPLSSVDDNPQGIGYQAAALLDRLLTGQRCSDRPLLVQPIGVVTRQSSDLLAVDHPLVAQALRLIRAHYREPFTAEGMLGALPISRRRLHDAFLHYVGRSAAAELERVRLEQAQRLLRETTAKLEVVARESGLRTSSHLHALFQRRCRLTPGAYRARHQQAAPHPETDAAPPASPAALPYTTPADSPLPHPVR